MSDQVGNPSNEDGAGSDALPEVPDLPTSPPLLPPPPVVPASSVAPDFSGWTADPTGRHEERLYVTGEPTSTVRDGGTEALDQEGVEILNAQLLPPVVPTTSASGDVITESPKSRKKLFALVIGGAAILLVVFGGITAAVLLGGGESKDSKYIKTLRSGGYIGEFSSDQNAIAQGKAICEDLKSGGKQQGMPSAKVAVDTYCPKFANGFKVLQKTTVRGTFTLIDTSPSTYFPAITSSGSSCWGSGGYSDVGAGTRVVLKNGKGEELNNATLGIGTGSRYRCVFTFSFEVTEGEPSYVLSVGRRGEQSYSFTDLKTSGVSLSMGD
jgi:hypothetical protein